MSNRTHDSEDAYKFELEKHQVTRGVRALVRSLSLINWPSLRVPSSAIHPLSKRARLIGRYMLKHDLRDKLIQVGRHEPFDALILRNAVSIPNWWNLHARTQLITNVDRDDWHNTSSARVIYRAMEQMIFYMGAVGYLPLVHCYHAKEPSYIFRAKAYAGPGN